MTKILKFVGLCLTFLMLCGCKGGNITPTLTDFECKGTAEIDGFEISFGMKNLSGGIFEVTINSPETLEGLALKWNGDSYTSHYKDMTVNMHTQNSNCHSFADELRQILSDAAQSDAIITADDPQLTGTVDAGNYKVEFRPDGFPVHIKLDALGLSVTMSDFKYVRS